MKINKLILTALLLCGLMASCTQSKEGMLPDKTAKVVATIGAQIQNRANLGGDNVSYASFVQNDQIGFYAQGGLEANNQLLTNNSGFSNPALQWTSGNARNVFAYFPHTNTPNDIKIYNSGKFIDILTVKNANVSEGAVINLGFNHRFALLSIVRSDGFDSATDKDITVALNKKVAVSAAISYDKNDFNNCDLTIATDLTNGIEELTSIEGNIIVPVATLDGTPLNMASIKLKNNSGREITIDYNIKDGFKSGNKYIITVTMRNNQAVVSPCEIVQWNEQDVTITKPVGIENATDLKEWITAYNGKDEANLAKFGTKDVSGRWTFPILYDIDFKKESTVNITPIENFKDILDGQGRTISGFDITEVDATGTHPLGFVRTLENAGVIKRLTLKNVIFHCKSNNPVGAFAGVTEIGSTIEKCNLTGSSIIYGAGTAGAIVGEDKGATLTDNIVESGVFVKQ